MNIQEYIAEYPGFPKDGINFKDISPLIASPQAFLHTCKTLANSMKQAHKIVALDARGFLFAPTVCQILQIPCIMARKTGKLPGETVQVNYGLEYGQDTIEIQTGWVQTGEKVGIIDDLLATGGTALAAIDLIEKLGGQVEHLGFVISLDDDFLTQSGTRKKLQDYSYSSVVSYKD